MNRVTKKGVVALSGVEKLVSWIADYMSPILTVVMTGQIMLVGPMMLTAFLVQPKPPAGALRPEILLQTTDSASDTIEAAVKYRDVRQDIVGSDGEFMGLGHRRSSSCRPQGLPVLIEGAGRNTPRCSLTRCCRARASCASVTVG
jgi:hypothetical protein